MSVAGGATEHSGVSGDSGVKGHRAVSGDSAVRAVAAPGPGMPLAVSSDLLGRAASRAVAAGGRAGRPMNVGAAASDAVVKATDRAVTDRVLVDPALDRELVDPSLADRVLVDRVLEVLRVPVDPARMIVHAGPILPEEEVGAIVRGRRTPVQPGVHAVARMLATGSHVPAARKVGTTDRDLNVLEGRGAEPAGVRQARGPARRPVLDGERGRATRVHEALAVGSGGRGTGPSPANVPVAIGRESRVSPGRTIVPPTGHGAKGRTVVGRARAAAVAIGRRGGGATLLGPSSPGVAGTKRARDPHTDPIVTAQIVTDQIVTVPAAPRPTAVTPDRAGPPGTGPTEARRVASGLTVVAQIVVAQIAVTQIVATQAVATQTARGPVEVGRSVASQTEAERAEGRGQTVTGQTVIDQTVVDRTVAGQSVVAPTVTGQTVAEESEPLVLEAAQGGIVVMASRATRSARRSTRRSPATNCRRRSSER